MKHKITLLLSLICLCGYSQANHSFGDSKNIVKWNVLGLTSSTLSVQYERILSENISFATTVNIMPQRSIPYFDNVRKTINDAGATDILKDVRMQAYSVIPEVRYYFGKESAQGFYIAPFFRYDRFVLDFPIEYIYKNELAFITLDGSVNGFSGGLSFGAQWQLATNWYLDVNFLGLSYGGANGKLSGKRPLDAEEQTNVKDALSDLEIDVIKYKYNVDANGAEVKIKGPWANAKFAVAVGYRF
ncbi:DUF3575 domain-containing protein [Myroides sp. JBRI-B21084]|uniref:DUF3575 domain-containing protein n=1 Tax=Myroides sp. JBRI-B21084 TaxID=3119977 RepID=UPI0026E391C4|nr:DUF3575 domain-containing protein [Paenimyroides cloacae]WKW46028.1 DUF3575 domain-containing protein [Paenimyroides cloacae]